MSAAGKRVPAGADKGAKIGVNAEPATKPPPFDLDDALGVGELHALVHVKPGPHSRFYSYITLRFQDRQHRVRHTFRDPSPWLHAFDRVRADLWDPGKMNPDDFGRNERLQIESCRRMAQLRGSQFEEALREPTAWLNARLVVCTPATCTHKKRGGGPKP